MDLMTCTKAELRVALSEMTVAQRRRVYKDRWKAKNPGVTDAAAADWAKRNPDKRKGYREKVALDREATGQLPYSTAYLRSNRHKAMFYSAQYRAKKKGLAFNITMDDIVIPDVCPVFGMKLETSDKVGRSDASPSLDRIDNRYGYIRGNIIVVSWFANRIKNDATPEQLRTVADFYGHQASQVSPVGVRC